jgi:hypothetical protein
VFEEVFQNWRSCPECRSGFRQCQLLACQFGLPRSPGGSPSAQPVAIVCLPHSGTTKIVLGAKEVRLHNRPSPTRVVGQQDAHARRHGLRRIASDHPGMGRKTHCLLAKSGGGYAR